MKTPPNDLYDWDHLPRRRVPCWAKLALIVLLIIIALQMARALAQEIVLPTPDEQRAMLGWIPHDCCVTNNCCFAVKNSELVQLPDSMVRIVATGQVLKRTDWSPLPTAIRCACDMIDGVWKVHRHARTRCVYPIPQMTRKD